MTPAWAQRQEALLHDCIVPPDVFDHIVERLRDFAVPYQAALETAAGKRNVSLYLQGLLSHLPRKNAEDIATLVNVESTFRTLCPGSMRIFRGGLSSETCPAI